MLNSISLRNFKSVTSPSPLRFARYSLICGSNSSGKSSVLQAILMMSQTFSSMNFKNSISLNGRLVKLGSFGDIMNYSSKEDFIDVAMELDISSNPSNSFGFSFVSISIRFSSAGERSKVGDGDFHPEILSGRIVVRGSDGSASTLDFGGGSARGKQNLFAVNELSPGIRELLEKECPDFKIEGLSKLEVIPSVVHLNYDHAKKVSLVVVDCLIGEGRLRRERDAEYASLKEAGIPGDVFGKIASMISEENEERIRNFVIPDEVMQLIESMPTAALRERLDVSRVKNLLARQSIILNSESVGFLGDFSGIGASLDQWREAVDLLDVKVKKALYDFMIRNRDVIQKVWYGSSKRSRKNIQIPLREFKFLNDYMRYVFDRSVKYLGPLRNEPQAMYQAFDLSETKLVGLKGEYTAAALHLNRSVRIDYPSVVEIEGGRLQFVMKSDTLGAACKEWLRYLGVVADVQTSDKGRLGYELKVKTNHDDEWQDLTHVGVGVSQVLPIVVMALLSNQDDILIFEQPELHLHPKVQSRLCDFFLAISSYQRQCVVETHSEYIINRLRLRVVQGGGGDYSIFFVDRSQGRAKFRYVDISPFGAIQDWPVDFFDQTNKEVEKILSEASAKRRAMKMAGDPGEKRDGQ